MEQRWILDGRKNLLSIGIGLWPNPCSGRRKKSLIYSNTLWGYVKNFETEDEWASAFV
jgi:hypothetical protein